MTRETRPLSPGSDTARDRSGEASVTGKPLGHDQEVPAEQASPANAWWPLSSDPDGGSLRAPGRVSGAATRDDRGGLGWLVLLLPVICCGGPVIVAALAAAGALAWGGIGLGLGVAVAAGVVVWARRRRAATCCAVPDPALDARFASGSRGGPHA